MKTKAFEQTFTNHESDHGMYQDGITSVIENIEDLVTNPNNDICGVNLFAVVAMKDGSIRLAEVEVNTDQFIKIQSTSYTTFDTAPEAAYNTMTEISDSIGDTIAEFDQGEETISKYGILEHRTLSNFEETIYGEVIETDE